MDLLFAADTPWNWDAEENYKRLAAENPQLVQAAQRSQSVDTEAGKPTSSSRRGSYAAVYGPSENKGAQRKRSMVNGDEKAKSVEL